MLTYGDGVADIDIPALIDFHRKSGKIATLTAVRPRAAYEARGKRAAQRFRSLGLLASDGHAQGQKGFERTLGRRPRPVENLGVDGSAFRKYILREEGAHNGARGI